MQLYLLLDTSGSMEGAKISALNDSMENIIVDLQEKALNGIDIKVSVLSFARHIKWMYKSPINILDFVWKPLTASGMTSLGLACCELAKAIVVNTQEENIAIVLLSDGCPTDDYDEGIKELRKLPRFNQANKFAIALGNNADIKSLLSFVDYQENIFLENKADSLLDVFDSIIRNIIPNVPQQPLSLTGSDDDDWE
ncbi:vWA domain-containing protein [Bacteroides congonensis]|uniref:vWA domain-containing protein n=1 Tax=Bacteroides congonensis TaxID=1871006 RepID=UPI00189DB721|nr:VWA domain-containing protein [Bacteroides congonensis]